MKEPGVWCEFVDWSTEYHDTILKMRMPAVPRVGEMIWFQGDHRVTSVDWEIEDREKGGKRAVKCIIYLNEGQETT